jgi:hypothetical protein
MVARCCEEIGRLLLGRGRLPKDPCNREGACGFGNGAVLEAVRRCAGGIDILGHNLRVEDANLNRVSRGACQTAGRLTKL